MKPAPPSEQAEPLGSAACNGWRGLVGDLSPFAFQRGLVILALLGLIVRFGFFIEHAQTPSFGVPTLDQLYYDTVARMLQAGQDLHALHGFRPLLYPIFLAGCYATAGTGGITFALIMQHVLGVATGLLVALLGARLYRHRLAGLIGGALYLLAPLPLCFEGELLIEPSYTFLVCLGLWLAVRAADMSGWRGGRWWLFCGGLTVLASQARANILVFLAAYPLFAAWCAWRWRTWRAWLPLLGVAGGLVMAIAWGFVNLKQSDHVQLLPGAGGVSLYLGNRRGADGMTPVQGRRVTTGERYEDSVEVWAREEYAASMRAQGLTPRDDPMAISRFWTRRTLDEIRADPAGWLRLMGRKGWLMLWNTEVPNNKAFSFLQDEFLWLRMLPVRWVVLLVLALPGIWAAVRWGRRDALILLLVYIGLYSAANLLFFVCDRYRYPVYPAMAALAGGGVTALVALMRRRKVREWACILGSMALMAALSLHNWCDVKLPSYARDYFFRALACCEKGQFAAALADIDRSVALDPGDASALQQRGIILLSLERHDDARTAFEQALAHAPEDASLWNNLGAALDALGRTNAALASYRRSLACQPPSANACLGAALLELRKGELDAAAALLDQYERVDSAPSAIARACRAVLERRRGNLPRAEAFERDARRLNAADAAWVFERAAAGR